MFLEACFKRLFKMFHLSVDVCCKRFNLDVATVCSKMFYLFQSSVAASVFMLQVVSVLSRCCI